MNIPLPTFLATPSARSFGLLQPAGRAIIQASYQAHHPVGGKCLVAELPNEVVDVPVNDTAADSSGQPDAATARNGHREAVTPSPTDADFLDWDTKIEVSPPRPVQSLLVRFVEGARRPLPVSDDPEE